VLVKGRADMAGWSGKRVLVTGAGGFIGSHLAERLVEEGAVVRALVHYNALGQRGWLDTSQHVGAMDVVAGDVTDPQSVDGAVRGCETVFHLAALIGIPYSYRAPDSYVRTNVVGTLNVLNAVRSCHTSRLVHTSTSEVYGTARYVPIDESHPLQGQSPYSASKIGADKMAEAFHLSFGVPVVTVRPFNTFGPRQSTRAVLPTIITQLIVGNTVRLGSTTPTRDLNFVSNTVDGFLAAALSDRAIGTVVNLGSGREIGIGDLVALVARMMGKEPRVVCDVERQRPVGSEVERLLADPTRARELLDWTPRVALEDGVHHTIEWLRGNIGRFRVGSYLT
jgi:dTDP-glucose 4,6-dehydratase